MRLFIIAIVFLLSAPIGAKPGGEAEFRSPGKPSHPLSMNVTLDRAALTAGVGTDAEIVVSSAVEVENLRVELRPAQGLQAHSNGALQKHVGRLHPGEPVRMPLRVTPTGDDGRRLVVLVEATQPDGRIISREFRLDLDAGEKRRAKLPRRHPPAPAESGEPGEATVEAEQETTRGK